MSMRQLGDEYDAMYREAAGSGGPPWVIGRAQPALAGVLESEVRGPKVLDAGCGTGDLAIALARRGYEVTAFDVSPVAIDEARTRAAGEGLTIRFDVRDATRSSPASAPFDSIFDCGLLHVLVRHGGTLADDYLALLPGLAAPGAAVFVLAMSLAAEGWGVTEEFLRDSFAEPRWTGTRIEDTGITAEFDGRAHTMRGFLLRTRRSVAL